MTTSITLNTTSVERVLNKVSHERYQDGIIVTFPTILLHDGNHYCRKETFFNSSLKSVLSFMEYDDVVVRSPISGKKRYNYIIYMLMEMYGEKTIINPCDYQYKGSIVMNNKGKKLTPIKNFYNPIIIGCNHSRR